jgi:hypothetical protein
MYKNQKLKKCPKCGHPEGLINCEKCHEEAVALEVNSLLDWRIYAEPSEKSSDTGSNQESK